MQVSGIQGVGNDIAGAGQAAPAAASQIDTQQFTNALQGSNSSGNVSGASGSGQMQDALAQILPLLLQLLQNLAGGEQMGGAGDSGCGGKGGGAGGPGMAGHGGGAEKAQGASSCG